ncbi:MAG: 2-oxoglutarate oxidoreductase, partial [Planctomycetes bacterium]|nr:2-oxoglutarate oxidoreductase [Planctomycetota bacterium]
GRKPTQEGYPLQVSELLATMPGARYIERVSLHNPAHIRKTKKAINHAFELQADGGHGLCLVEILSPCPTYWRKSQMESRKWIEEEMMKVYPLGKYKG